MDEEIPDPTPEGAEAGAATTFSLLQRLLAGIALAALLASAAISSWWILDGQADFVGALGKPQHAAENTPAIPTSPEDHTH